MKERIVKLAVEHGVMCRHTSFIVVETRTGDRRANGQPATRVVPVALPAGWAMFDRQSTLTGGPGMAPPAPMAAAASMTRAGGFASMGAGAFGGPPVGAPPSQKAKGGDLQPNIAAKKAANERFRRRQDAPADENLVAPSDPLTALLGRQLASGLWDESDSTADDEVRRARATARALLELVDLGVSSAHALHGAQVKKAIEALMLIVAAVAQRDRKVAELALGAAWLASSGRRTRRQIEDEVAKSAVTLRVWLADEIALKAHLAQLSA